MYHIHGQEDNSVKCWYCEMFYLPKLISVTEIRFQKHFFLRLSMILQSMWKCKGQRIVDSEDQQDANLLNQIRLVNCDYENSVALIQIVKLMKFRYVILWNINTWYNWNINMSVSRHK